jgi:hypothetical protein
LTTPLPSERIPYAVGPCPTSTVVCAAPQARQTMFRRLVREGKRYC